MKPAYTSLGGGIVPRVMDGERGLFPARDPSTKRYDATVVAIADRTNKPVDLVDRAVFLTRRDVYAATGRPANDAELLEVYPLSIAGGDARIEMATEREAALVVHDG